MKKKKKPSYPGSSKIVTHWNPFTLLQEVASLNEKTCQWIIYLK